MPDGIDVVVNNDPGARGEEQYRRIQQKLQFVVQRKNAQRAIGLYLGELLLRNNILLKKPFCRKFFIGFHSFSVGCQSNIHRFGFGCNL